MKFIDRSRIEVKVKVLKWDEIEESHMKAMLSMSVTERKEYIKKHTDWNKLKTLLLELSHNKCWYTEALIGSSDFEIDHFRPKNRSKQKIDYKDPLSKPKILKENGYWWLAYDWTNYRLCGGLVNKLRKDRSGDSTVQGKGDYFPLDLRDVGKVAEDFEDVKCEIPILLDPCNEEDVCLLSFDSNGEAISAGLDDYEDDRVLQSIFYYHLNLDQLILERLQTWKDCENKIKEIKNLIDEAPDERARRYAVKSGLKELKKYVLDPNLPYSAVIKACIEVYSQLKEYRWLKRFRDKILLGITE